MSYSEIYTRRNWQNDPDTSTPLDADNLNAMDAALKTIDTRVVNIGNDAVYPSDIENALYGQPTIDQTTGIITFPKKGGGSYTLDTLLEKIVTNWTFDAATQSIILTLPDGSTQSIPLSSFIAETEFVDTSSIAFTVANHQVQAVVKDHSIGDQQMQTSYKAECEAARDDAEDSADASADSALDSEAWATGKRAGSDVPSTDPTYNNNSKYYSEQADALGQAQAENSEAWANGTRGGVDVPSTDPAYHNNAKYWKDQAQAIAGGGVTTFNGRTGDVTPASSDYDASQIDYDNTASSLTATDVQDAIDEVAGALHKEEVTVTGNPLSFTTDSSQVASNTVITLEPIQAGSGDPSPSNVRAISGYEKVEVVACGKNVCDEEWELGTLNNDTGAELNVSDRIRSKNFIPVFPGTSYYFKNGGSGNIYTWFYDINKNFISFTSTNNAIVSTPSNAYFIRLSPNATYGATYGNNISVNYPSTATAYEPYNPLTDFSIAMPSTIYGGTLDVESGELTVDKGIIVYDGSSDEEWIKNNYFTNTYYIAKKPINFNTAYSCNSYIEKTSPDEAAQCFTIGTFINFKDSINGASLSAWKAYIASNNIQVIYTLATPITYNLTPHQVALLQGANVVTTNGTSMSLTYRNGEVAKLSDLRGLANSINADVVKASNRNLLDNPWFTVNQRGITSGSTIHNGYTVDRWKTSYGSSMGTWSVSSSGFTITAAAGTYAQITQVLENPSDFDGKQVTLSALLSNGTIYSYSFIRVDGTEQTKAIGNFRIRWHSNGAILFFALNGSSYTIRAVKLEIGSTSTLHLDTAPDYTTELLKCQRHYYEITLTTLGYALGTTKLDLSQQFFPTEMRIAPTASFTEVYYRLGDDAWTTASNVGSTPTKDRWGLRIITTGLTNGQAYLVSIGKVTFSAEL